MTDDDLEHRANALAARWVELLEGPHFIVPAPVIKREEILTLARAYLQLQWSGRMKGCGFDGTNFQAAAPSLPQSGGPNGK